MSYQNLYVSCGNSPDSLEDNCTMEWVTLLCPCQGCTMFRASSTKVTDLPPCSNHDVATVVQSLNDNASEHDRQRFTERLDRVTTLAKSTKADVVITAAVKAFLWSKLLELNPRSELIADMEHYEKQDRTGLYHMGAVLNAAQMESSQAPQPMSSVLDELLDTLEKTHAEAGTLADLEAEFCKFTEELYAS